MLNGSMFATLHNFSDTAFFNERSFLKLERVSRFSQEIIFASIYIEFNGNNYSAFRVEYQAERAFANGNIYCALASATGNSANAGIVQPRHAASVGRGVYDNTSALIFRKSLLRCLLPKVGTFPNSATL